MGMTDRQTMTFHQVPAFLCDPRNEGRLRDHLDRYYGNPPFSGRHFETFISRSAPDRFDGYNVAAVATLSVPLDRHAVVGLLIEHEAELNELLADCPSPDAKVWEVSEDELGEQAPITRLYETLKSLRGVGYVRASKLLASKRPHLVPIRDSVVEELLGKPSNWWLPIRAVVSVDDVRSRLLDLAHGVANPNISVLRILDVILWMEGDKRGFGKGKRDGVAPRRDRGG